jgi:hypothetical protein
MPYGEVSVGYEWIFDVLKDVKAFAEANNMPALAAKSEETLKVAAQEVAVRTSTALDNKGEAPKV